jgi:glycolate oxidase
MVGSEGTLGIATRITLRLLPLPESVRTLAAYFPSVGAAAGAASAVIAKRILPRALEFVDQAALRAVETYLKEDLSGGAAAMLLVEVDGPVEATAREIATVGSVMHSSGATRIEPAENEADRERIWKARRAISPALYTIKPKKLNEDIVVPRSRIPDILRAIDAIADRTGLLIVNFGHAGDGNIHTNVMIDEADLEKGKAAVLDIFKETLRLGGSISGEHGIGTSKAAYLPLELGTDALNAMKRIKQILDPNNILNPGKIFL